jgi:alpha-tubulin suppressor-like RCC1 family protein
MTIKVQGTTVIDNSQNATLNGLNATTGSITTLAATTANVATANINNLIVTGTVTGISTGGGFDTGAYTLTKNQLDNFQNLKAVALTGKFDDLAGNITATNVTVTGSFNGSAQDAVARNIANTAYSLAVAGAPAAAYAWGYNISGYQFNDGTSNSRTTPAPYNGASFRGITSGSGGNYDSTMFITTSGALFGCGYNAVGELGLGSTVTVSTAVQVGTLTNWKEVSHTGEMTAAVKTDGTLWTWGNNGSYNLGQGTSTSLSSPVQVGTLNSWRTVSSSKSGSVGIAAIKYDGTLWACGYGRGIGIGLTSFANVSTLVQVGAATNWKSVSNGGYFSAGIQTNGTLWAWGINGSYQLGQGNSNNASVPLQVGTATNWSQVSANGSQTSGYMMAIKTDGTLWACGYQTASSPSLGLGTGVVVSTMVQVGSATNWKQVDVAYSAQVMAVKTDGTLWAWGSNSYYTLGLGTTSTISTPVQVGTLTNWKSVSLSQKTGVGLVYPVTSGIFNPVYPGEDPNQQGAYT